MECAKYNKCNSKEKGVHCHPDHWPCFENLETSVEQNRIKLLENVLRTILQESVGITELLPWPDSQKVRWLRSLALEALYE